MWRGVGRDESGRKLDIDANVSILHSCIVCTTRLFSAVFTCIGALGTPSRTGPLARKYLHGFPYS